MIQKISEKPLFLVYVYAFLLLIATTIPTSDLLRIQRVNRIFSLILSDKSLHFIGFGLLAWLLCYGYRQAHKRFFYIRSGVVSVGYGLLIELIQIFLPYRMFSFGDLAADAAGVVVALGLFYAFTTRRP
ncbi:MAG: VanZ family protein [Candidatus Aminicenantes bacterium]|nr:VanZ family protein [Candidatus Aminicenantes bacterium]